MTSTLSLLAELDDIRRCQAVLYDGAAEEQFLRFAALQEECRLQWLAAVQEGQRLQRELDDSLKQMSDLESKLYHARRLLDVECKLRKDAEQERDNLEKKLIVVANVVQDPSFPTETREKLDFISGQSKKRKSKNVEEKYGNEINSTGSFLSDLSVTHSEDDFLDGNTSKTWKRHRPSLSKQNGTFVGTKPSKLSREQNECRRKSKNNSELYQKHNADGAADEKILATTKVTIPSSGGGPIIAESTIETLPVAETNVNEVKCSKNLFSSTNEMNNIEKNVERERKNLRIREQKCCTPTAPPLTEINENNKHTLSTPLHSLRRSLLRHHNFASKTFIKPDNCSHCNKKIRFGSLALKCKNCRVSVHSDCKDSLSSMCIPSSAGGTPTFKGLMGYLTEYAPSTPPMIPPVIIQCVAEIEKKGLNEVGIYRISGSEREVKTLKEKFLRGKCPPNLTNIDVHVLCGCIKDFLRSLREPLVPTDLWSDFSNAIQLKTEEEREKELFRAIDRLPQANRDTLAFLILHFQRIARCADIKMPLGNLARIFGPTIVGYSSPDPDRNAIYSETMTQFQVMESLINISENYWSKYVLISRDVEREFILNSQLISHTPKTDKTSYSTPFKGSIKKDRKFYGTPPYSAKKY